MILFTIFVFILGFGLGWCVTIERVEELSPETYETMIQETRNKWDSFIDTLKTRSKKDKIVELKKELEELENG